MDGLSAAMRPRLMAWSEIARAPLAGGDVLTLRRSGADFEIRLNLFELMSSRNSVSERALAELACAQVAGPVDRVLIGGLGLGYTLRSVLDSVGGETRVVVAELVPEVVAWNRGPVGDAAGRPLDDPRVTVHQGDVLDVARAHPRGFDVVLMDVDNGPDAVLFPANRFLYSVEGVGQIVSSLRPGGVLALWAADRSPAFERVLADGGFRSDRLDVDVRGGDGPSHSLYVVLT